VADNIVQGGINVIGPDGADVSSNYIYDFDHVGIFFGYIGAIGVATNKNSYCGENTIIAATPGGAVTEIYEGIRFTSDTGIDISNITLGPNTIIGADMCAASSGGNSANLGAISFQTGGSYAGDIHIGAQNIIGCGRDGIVLYSALDFTISGVTFRNIGADASGIVVNGVRLVTSANRVRIDGVKAYDNRGGSSRLATVVTVSGAGNFDGNVVKNCKAIGVKAGEVGINLGNPFVTPTLIEIGGNGISSAPVTGQFTMTAAAQLDIANTSVISTSPTYYSSVILIPMNVAAHTLQQGSKRLIVSSTTAKTGFRVQTYDGTNAAGTEVFSYQIIQ
jgi:hypothetical protein